MTENRGLITVVVPAHNREETLKRTLRSIGAQTLRPFSVVLVDNASTDDTSGTMRKWAESPQASGIDVTVVEEGAPGAAAARNRGLREVKTPYVAFFDSDDEMRPTHLETVLGNFAAFPGCDLLAFDSCQMDEDGWTRSLAVTDSDSMRGQILHSLLATTRFAASTELVRASGGWNESLPVWNDLELGVRLLLNADCLRVAHSVEAPVVVHQMADSISSMPLAGRAGEFNAALGEIEGWLSARGREDAMKWVDVRRVAAAAGFRRVGDKAGATLLTAQVWKKKRPLSHTLLLRGYSLYKRFF